MDENPRKPKTPKNAQLHDQPPQPEAEAEDRLSTLPDAILVDILSLLSTSNAVSTSVLSNRWHFLYTQLNNLRLDCRQFTPQFPDFYAVVDRLLSSLTSASIATFSVCAPYPPQDHYFAPWLRLICARNVENIDISFAGAAGSSIPVTLDQCVFQTASLVCVSLPRFQLPDNGSDFVVELPNLKKLSLIMTSLQCDFVTELVRSCPLLEDLSLTADDQGLDFSEGGVSPFIEVLCGNLKRLYLNLLGAVGDDNVVVIRVNAPKLESFCLKGHCLVSCCFVSKPKDLGEIEIITCSRGLVESLLPVISNVKLLHMRAQTFGMFKGFKDEHGNSLVFRNLTDLCLRLGDGIVDTLDKLDCFPFESSSPSILLHIKRISVTVYDVKHGKDLLRLAEYLISNTPGLERLTFVVRDRPSLAEEGTKYVLEEMLFCIDLYSCSKKFSQCKIEFRGHHAKVPFNIAELLELENQVKTLRRVLSVEDNITAL